MRRIALAVLIIPIILSCQSLAICQQNNEITIATFNIRIFSNGSRDDNELRQICDVLKRYDFVALQEVRDTIILDRTIAMLADEFRLDYQYVASPEVGRGVKELYAFLYRTEKVICLGESSVWEDLGDDFIREPFYALFRAGEFDFYVITIHSIYGDSIGDRRYEAQLLDEVYTAIQGLNDENDVLLMGDFNLDPLDSGFEGLRDLPNMIFVNENLPTSIKDRLYDNIWFQSSYTTEYEGDYGVLKFDEDIYENDDAAASLAVSDHRPLWAKFNIKEDDD